MSKKNPNSGRQKRKAKIKEREDYWANVTKEQAKKERVKKEQAEKAKDEE